MTPERSLQQTFKSGTFKYTRVGYAQAADRFFELSESITFEKLHKPILEFVPTTESDVLDIGSGSGRDAAALARTGHNVTAVEPNSGFIETATHIHPLPNIQWIEDSLPSRCVMALLEMEHTISRLPRMKPSPRQHVLV